MNNLPAETTAPTVVTQRDPIALVKAEITLVKKCLKDAMQDGIHYGAIGDATKPALLKPGAEMICALFKLVAVPTEKKERELGEGHREYEVSMMLQTREGVPLGYGVGLCSTMESRYRYRWGSKKCPQCDEAAIIKGKEEYGGGWICFRKKGGCGAKYQDDDPQITSQKEGRVENPDIADQHNTVLKMAMKRAHVDAVLRATAASDIFTQDIGDNEVAAAAPAKKKAQDFGSYPDAEPAEGVEFIYDFREMEEDIYEQTYDKCLTKLNLQFVDGRQWKSVSRISPMDKFDFYLAHNVAARANDAPPPDDDLPDSFHPEAEGAGNG